MKQRKIKITLNSPVILSFVFLSAAALLLDRLTGGRSNSLLFLSYRSSLGNILTYVRLFTHVLGHSGLAHFTSNMAYILLLGPMLEEKYSSKKIIWVILATAFFTGLVNFVFFPGQALCGASGVCFAFMLLSSLTAFKKGEIPLTFILVTVFFLGQQIIQGVTVSDNVSQMAHILGGIIGASFGFAITKRKGA